MHFGALNAGSERHHALLWLEVFARFGGALDGPVDQYDRPFCGPRQFDAEDHCAGARLGRVDRCLDSQALFLASGRALIFADRSQALFLAHGRTWFLITGRALILAGSEALLLALGSLRGHLRASGCRSGSGRFLWRGRRGRSGHPDRLWPDRAWRQASLRLSRRLLASLAAQDVALADADYLAAPANLINAVGPTEELARNPLPLCDLDPHFLDVPDGHLAHAADRPLDDHGIAGRVDDRTLEHLAALQDNGISPKVGGCAGPDHHQQRQRRPAEGWTALSHAR